MVCHVDKIGDPITTQTFIERQMLTEGIPTCQGIKPSDYRAHARDLKGFPLIGVGNLVRKDINHQEIIDEILTELPDVKLHLWGFGLKRLKNINLMGVQSVDSSSWNGRWGKGLAEYQESRKQGYTQRRYAIEVMLPRYKTKIDKWINRPQQLLLF